LPAATALQWSGETDATLSTVWLNWFLSDLAGIAVMTPLVVAIIDLVRAPAPKYDWRLDIVLLLLFGFAAHDSLGLRADSGTWQTLAPSATSLPILLWIAARAQPIVPALAVAVLGVILESFAIMGTGRYGDVRVPYGERVFAAQITLSIASLLTLSISALFAAQRSAQARLRASEQRLAVIADVAPGVIFSLERRSDGRLRPLFVSGAAAEMLNIEPENLTADPAVFFDRLDHDDRAALIKALAGNGEDQSVLHLELPLLPDARGEIWLEISARSNREADGSLVWHGFIRDITFRRRLLDELGHRTRNLLSVVQAITEYTARGTPPRELGAKISERLAGLAVSHDLLASRDWDGIEIHSLVKSQLAHLESLFSTRLKIEGPTLTLRPQAAQAIGMAVHELATNACKHGALSREGGTIRLSWISPDEDADEHFRMLWEERGGPAYEAPARKGFGHKVIVDMAAFQLGADVVLASAADGLEWRLAAPRHKVLLEPGRPRT